MNSSANIVNTEILQIAESVAREKGVLKEAVIDAMEQAIQTAGRRKYGHEHNIKAEIDKKTGEIRLFRLLTVVKDVEDYFTQISLEDARSRNPEINYDEFIYDPLPPIDLGRVAAKIAKQVLVKNIQELEKQRQYDEYKEKEGSIVNIIVKRIEYGNIIADLGRGTEGFLKKDALIPNEMFRQNDRVRAYIASVKRDNKGPQILLSRTANEFLAKLFVQEVPEIYDNIIEIKSVAREPGSKAKISVYTSDTNIDPVGSCVGVRGSRVQAVISELQGEKIDIIQWSSDPATYVVNALAPAEVSKVVLHEEKKRIEVVVASDQLSLAIGRRGQNVRLASQLTGWNIDVLTDDEESKRRIDEFNNISQMFIESLDVEEVLAQLLAAEGFTSVEEIAYISKDELLSIEGFDEELANALQLRAASCIKELNNKIKDQLKKLGVEKELEEYLNINLEDLLILANNGIKNIEDFADLSTDEFFELLPNSEKTKDEIDSLIMEAREKTA
ncbi:MAG: transcription termination factor NusA [Alphaproteobacteria bacterium]